MALIGDDTITTATLIHEDVSEDITATTTVISEDKKEAKISNSGDTTKATPVPVPVPVPVSIVSAVVIPESDSVPCKIEEGLYLGSLMAAHNKDELKKLNITHILGVLVLTTPAYPDDFTYKTIEIYDNVDTNIMQHFDDCFKFIEEAKSRGGGVLVHCYMGMSRSASIVIAYMMKKYGTTLSETLELVKAKRPIVEPNRGFMLQLQQFENSLQAFKSAMLRQMLRPSPFSYSS